MRKKLGALGSLVLALFMIFAIGSQVFAANVAEMNTTSEPSLELVRNDGSSAGTNAGTNAGPGMSGARQPVNDNFMNNNNNNNNGIGINDMDGVRNDAGTNGMRDGNRYGTRGMMSNNLRTRAVGDNGTNWGWLGILGLIGLAGMAGRNRATDRDR